jgi:hypothetical protein
MFSTLPPEDLATAGRCSHWRSFKLLLGAILGELTALKLAATQAFDRRTHILLADTKRRKRKRQTLSLLRPLS